MVPEVSQMVSRDGVRRNYPKSVGACCRKSVRGKFSLYQRIPKCCLAARAPGHNAAHVSPFHLLKSAVLVTRLFPTCFCLFPYSLCLFPPPLFGRLLHVSSLSHFYLLPPLLPLPIQLSYPTILSTIIITINYHHHHYYYHHYHHNHYHITIINIIITIIISALLLSLPLPLPLLPSFSALWPSLPSLFAVISALPSSQF